MFEEKMTFISSDGTELVGILATPEKTTTKCIVLCHGITADKDEEGVFVELSESLVEKNYAVFRFDFSGHGESGGRSIDMSITGEVKDLESAIGFLEKRGLPALPAGRQGGRQGFTTFGLLGASFGGGIVSLYTGNHVQKVKALVLWNPLLDYALRVNPTTVWGKKYMGQPAIDRINRLGYTEVGSKSFRVGKKLFDEMSMFEPWKGIVDLAVPTLFVHGNKDTIIDYHDSVKYSLLMKNADLEIIRGASHGFDDNEDVIKEVVEKTVAFFIKNM